MHQTSLSFTFVFAIAVAVGCGPPARAPLDARAAKALALLKGARADVIAPDAVLVGFTPGQAIETTGELNGSHDIFRVDVQVDGKPARLFARLSEKSSQVSPEGATSDGVTLRMVAVMQEPPASRADHPSPKGLAHYEAAWNASSEDRPRELDAGFATDGDYVDPQASLQDRASLDKHIAQFHNDVPAGSIEPTTGTLQNGVAARFKWVTRMGPLGVQDGEDLVILDNDGKVSLVAGYWD